MERSGCASILNCFSRTAIETPAPVAMNVPTVSGLRSTPGFAAVFFGAAAFAFAGFAFALALGAAAFFFAFLLTPLSFAGVAGGLPGMRNASATCPGTCWCWAFALASRIALRCASFTPIVAIRHLPLIG